MKPPRKAIPAERQDLISGRNPVREALERGDATFEKILLQQGARGLENIHRLATREGVQVQFVPPNKLDALAAGLNHQGAVAVVAPVSYLDLDEMLAMVAGTHDDVVARKPIILVLDQIEDPHNLGAILRSAVAAGAVGVVLPRHHAAPVNATVIKVSAGTALRIPIARVTNLADSLANLKERGFWVAGAAGEEGALSMWEMDWDRPLVLVIGNEGAGLRPRVRDTCDYLVSIPMHGPAESLNASVAAGVLLFVASRSR